MSVWRISIAIPSDSKPSGVDEQAAAVDSLEVNYESLEVILNLSRCGCVLDYFYKIDPLWYNPYYTC